MRCASAGYDVMRKMPAKRVNILRRLLTKLRRMSVTRWILTALSFAMMFGASAWVVTANWPLAACR